MHVGSCMVFDGPAADARRARRARRGAPAPRPALPPAARVRRRSARAARCGSTTRTSTPATTCATRRCPRPGSDEQLQAPRRPRLLAAARPRQAAVGDLARRRGSTGDRFAILAKTHHALVDGISGVDITTVLFDVDARARRRRRRPNSRGSRGPLPSARPAAGRRAARARDRARPRSCAGVRARRAPPAARRDGAVRRRLSASAAFALPGARSAPPSPLNVPIGPHRRFAWVDERPRRSSRRSRTRSAARSTTSCSRPSPARCGRYLRAHGHDDDRPRAARRWCRSPCAPTPSAARSATASPPMYAPLPVGDDRPGRALRARPRARWRASRSPARPSAPRC